MHTIGTVKMKGCNESLFTGVHLFKLVKLEKGRPILWAMITLIFKVSNNSYEVFFSLRSQHLGTIPKERIYMHILEFCTCYCSISHHIFACILYEIMF